MPEEIKVCVFTTCNLLLCFEQAPNIAGMRKREVQEEKEMERYEEEHFVRLQRKKKKETGRGVNDAIRELTDFGDIHTLTEDNLDKVGITCMKKITWCFAYLQSLPRKRENFPSYEENSRRKVIQ